MGYKYDEDLFANTTMTFGEHLEELRSSLWKAVLSLVVCFVIGLFVGDWVVRRIQDPLVAALDAYYKQQAILRIQNWVAERKKAGQMIPPAFANPENIEKLVTEGGLLPEEVYVFPAEIISELKRLKVPQAESLSLAEIPSREATAQAGMMRFYLWRSIAEDNRRHLITLSPQEGFMIYLKAALLTGAVISSPLVFYFLWSFVAAGLYPHERKYVHFFGPFSLLLFLAGASMAFFFVFPPVLQFFFSYNAALGVDTQPRLSEWMSFVLLLPLGFGVAFQLPLVMLFLERIGIFGVEDYLRKWRMAVLVMAVASMVLTPGGDPTSMMLMLGPLILLYFGGISLCRLMPRSETRPD